VPESRGSGSLFFVVAVILELSCVHKGSSVFYISKHQEQECVLGVSLAFGSRKGNPLDFSAPKVHLG